MSNEESSITAEPEGALQAREDLGAARTATLPLVGGGFEDAATDTDVTQAAAASAANRLASGSANLEGVILSERYRMGECLGVGGMGTVWRVEHLLMKKTVGMNVPAPDL